MCIRDSLVNAQTKEYDSEILQALGLPETMFPKLTAPGTVLGLSLIHISPVSGISASTAAPTLT